jgi:hypothetical protein
MFKNWYKNLGYFLEFKSLVKPKFIGFEKLLKNQRLESYNYKKYEEFL